MRARSGGGACCGSPTDIRIGGSLARGVMPCSSSPNRAKGLSARRASRALAGKDESSSERFLPRRRASTAQSGNIIRATCRPAKGSDGGTQYIVAKKGRDRLPVEALPRIQRFCRLRWGRPAPAAADRQSLSSFLLHRGKSIHNNDTINCNAFRSHGAPVFPPFRALD